MNISISLDKIIELTISLVITALVAGITWFIKNYYEIYSKERKSIAILERLFSDNLNIIEDDLDFLNQWEEALKQRAFYLTNFDNTIIDDKSHIYLRNMDVVNQVVHTNHMLKRVNMDLHNIYDGYRDIKTAVKEKSITSDELNAAMSGIEKVVRDIRIEIKKVRKAVYRTIALLQLNSHVQNHSFFGYLSLLNKYIYPRITSSKILKRSKELEDHAKSLKSNYDE